MTTVMRVLASNAIITVNGNQYRAGPDGVTAQVQSADVSGAQAAGWVSLTQRMSAPQFSQAQTPQVSVGTHVYNVMSDGTIWADPLDVSMLEAMGFSPISSGYTAPTVTPTTFALKTVSPLTGYTGPSGATYQTDSSGNLSGVKPQDVSGAIVGLGGIVSSVTGAGGTHTVTVS